MTENVDQYDECFRGRTLAELRAMPDEEIVRCHDVVTVDTGYMGAEEYRAELLRRQNDRLSRQIFWLTVIATFATVASVVISVVALLVS